MISSKYFCQGLFVDLNNLLYCQCSDEETQQTISKKETRTMIYKCENCINNDKCPENQTQYKQLCDAIEILINDSDYHCYYSLNLKCDYYIPDKGQIPSDIPCCPASGGV